MTILDILRRRGHAGPPDRCWACFPGTAAGDMCDRHLQMVVEAAKREGHLTLFPGETQQVRFAPFYGLLDETSPDDTGDTESDQ